jgi:hypothetical protein
MRHLPEICFYYAKNESKRQVFAIIAQKLLPFHKLLQNGKVMNPRRHAGIHALLG